jgi:hypothetical protein
MTSQLGIPHIFIKFKEIFQMGRMGEAPDLEEYMARRLDKSNNSLSSSS